MEVVRNSVAPATTECPSTMTFKCCLFEARCGVNGEESIPPCGSESFPQLVDVFFFRLTSWLTEYVFFSRGHATLRSETTFRLFEKARNNRQSQQLFFAIPSCYVLFGFLNRTCNSVHVRVRKDDASVHLTVPDSGKVRWVW